MGETFLIVKMAIATEEHCYGVSLNIGVHTISFFKISNGEAAEAFWIRKVKNVKKNSGMS